MSGQGVAINKSRKSEFSRNRRDSMSIRIRFLHVRIKDNVFRQGLKRYVRRYQVNQQYRKSTILMSP